MTSRLLWFALLAHLSIAIFMFSNNDALKVGRVM
jgi:hypothetical protein